MTIHTATWDNGVVLTGDMTQTFTRNTTAWVYGYAGAAASVGVDTPRYGEDSLLFGARTIEPILASTPNCMAFTAGYDRTGQAKVIFRLNNGDGTTTIHVYNDGASPVSAVTRDLDASLGAFLKPADEDDILAGETDEEEDYLYQPQCAKFFRGLLVAWCHVKVYAGSGDRDLSASWGPFGTGLVYSGDGGATWNLWYRCREDNYATTTDVYTATWSGRVDLLERDGSDDTVEVLVTDYNNVTPRTATTYYSRATFSGGAWTPQAARRQAHTVVTTSKTHNHTVVIVADPDVAGGAIIRVLLGDTFTDNRIEELVCSDIANYLTGATDRANSVNVKEGGSNWSGPTVVNGSTGASGTDAPQSVGLAPAVADGTFTMGGDEEFGMPIAYAAMPSAGDALNYLRAWGYTTTDWTRGNWRSFAHDAWEIEAADPAVVATVAAGNAWPANSEDITRILYKPSGETAFGVLAALLDEPNSPEQVRVVLSPAGYVWFGSLNAHGIRRIKCPTTWRKQRAIAAGPGCTNYALKTPTVRSGGTPGSGNTVTIGATPPEAAPSDGAVMHFQIGSASNNMGHFLITPDAIVANGHTWMHLVILVYAPEWDGSTVTNHADMFWRLQLYTNEHGTGGANIPFGSPNRMSTRGAWLRLEYQFENGVSGDWNLATYGAELVTLVGRFQTNNATVHPQDFYAVISSIKFDEEPSAYDPPTTTGTPTDGDDESLVLDGFTCGAAWTAYLVASNPDSGRDCLWHTAGTFRTVATLWEDADLQVRVQWDAQSKVRIIISDGITADTVEEITGLPLLIRGDPLLVAVAWDGADYNYALSVGGSEIVTGTISGATEVSPTELRLAQNEDASEFEATRWFWAAINDSAADADLSDFVSSGTITTPAVSHAPASAIGFGIGIAL